MWSFEFRKCFRTRSSNSVATSNWHDHWSPFSLLSQHLRVFTKAHKRCTLQLACGHAWMSRCVMTKSLNFVHAEPCFLTPIFLPCLVFLFCFAETCRRGNGKTILFVGKEPFYINGNVKRSEKDEDIALDDLDAIP